MATVDLCPSGHQLSQAQGISGYDASYLAMARRHGATPLTADGRRPIRPTPCLRRSNVARGTPIYRSGHGLEASALPFLPLCHNIQTLLPRCARWP
jgi:hypothetical protein